MDIKKLENERFAVLIGKNSSGKTTRLKELKEEAFYIKNSIVISFELPSNRYAILQYDDKGKKLSNKKSYIGLFNFKNIFEIIKKYFKDLDTNKEIFETSIQNLNSKLSEFQSNIELEIYSEYKDNKDTRIHFKNQNSYKKLNEISSGLKSLVLIIFNIELLKEFIKKNNSKSKIFIFIDEPECYIHPQWQKKLRDYLILFYNEFEMVNILYATHSPYMISSEYFDKINLVKYEEEIKIIPILDDRLQIENSEINIFQPIEDALGFKFNIFDTPFITVEGQQEYSLFQSLIYHPNNKLSHRVLNLKGATNLTPYLIVANSIIDRGEELNTLFILDADVDLKKDFKGVPKDIINKLKSYFLFIGKELYTFDEYENLEYQTECLEDYFANQLLGYEEIESIILNTMNNYILQCNNNELDEKLQIDIEQTDFKQCFEHQQNNINFKKLLQCFCKSFKFEEYKCGNNTDNESSHIYKKERSILKHNKEGFYEKIKNEVFFKIKEHNDYAKFLDSLRIDLEKYLV